MIHLTATFHAQLGKEQQLKEVLTQALEPTRNEEGCVRYQLFQDKDTRATSFFKSNLKTKKRSNFTVKLSTLHV